MHGHMNVEYWKLFWTFLRKQNGMNSIKLGDLISLWISFALINGVVKCLTFTAFFEKLHSYL